MKIGFHFEAEHKDIGSPWHIRPQREVFAALLNQSTWDGSSKVYLGDMLFHTAVDAVGKQIEKSRDELTMLVLGNWLAPSSYRWLAIDEGRVANMMPNTIFAICLETVSRSAALHIHETLRRLPYYVGAVEVDDTNPIQYYLYSRLIAKGRIGLRWFNVFVQTMEPDDAQEWMIREYVEMGLFDRVEFEVLGGRHSIFDKEDDYEHASRVAQARGIAADILGTLADETIAMYRDSIPGFADSIWSLLDTYEQADTEEKNAQVALTCRRLMDRVANELFPPVTGDEQLGEAQSRNRLYAYAQQHASGGKDSKLLTRELDDLFSRLSAIAGLANKNIHGAVLRSEVRRVVIRTLLFLDDYAALSGGVLPTKIASIPIEVFRKMLLGENP